MKKIIVANWKNSVNTLAQASDLLESYNNCLTELPEQNFSLIVCPPTQFLSEVAKLLDTRMVLGAQDTSPGLKDLGVRYVIVGHSDRRWPARLSPNETQAGESDADVNAKLKTVLKDEMTPTICLGERGRKNDWQNFLIQQTRATFTGLSSDEISRCLIAYEPVWAISTTPGAKPDNPESALESIKIIRETLGVDVKVLYGGSVTSSNAHDFLSQDGIDGVLVGGTSINKEEFAEILSRL